MDDTKLSPWQRFIRLLSLERKDIYQIFFYAIFSGVVSLSLPLGIQAIINLIQGAQISVSWVILVILVTIGVVISGVLQLMQLRIIETIQQRIFVKASFELSYRFPKIKLQELRNQYAPELANRFFDTLTIQKGLSKVLIDTPAALLQILFALILLAFYHPLFIAFGLVLLAFVYLTFQYTAKKGLKTSLQESKYKYQVAHWIQEISRSIVSLKVSRDSSFALDKNDQLVEKYLNAREDHFKIIKLQFAKMIGFKAIITLGLLIIGGALVLNQQMNIGQFVAAEIIILLVINSVEKLILGLETLYDMLTAIEKLGLVVDKELESTEGSEPDFSNGITLELDQLSYMAPDRNKPILEDISLSIPSKSRILLEGKNGSGKSSLLRILAGLHSPSSGNLYINDLTIDSINIGYYRGHIGISFTETALFEASLRDNLTFGVKSITDEQIVEVLKVMGLLQFTQKLPEGLNTIIFPDDKVISNSVLKKMILTRAILKQPKLLFLEDALDAMHESESQDIIEYLCDEKQPWTLVVVSNNSYWKNFCSQTITLEDGKYLPKQ